MLLYSVCYYYGKNKKNNLIHHLDFFNKIKEKDDIFILTVMIDSKDMEIHNKVKYELSNLIEMSRLLSNNNYKIFIYIKAPPLPPVPPLVVIETLMSRCGFGVPFLEPL